MKKEIIEKVNSDFDFIDLPKYQYSLKILLEKHPTGVSDTVICKALCLSQTELDEVLNYAIIRLKESVGVADDEI